MHEDRGDVVGECSVIFSHAPQRMPHDHVTKQRERCTSAERLLDERAEKPRIIEDRVDSAVAQHRFGVVGSTDASACQKMHGKLCIVTRERVADVREDHERSSRKGFARVFSRHTPLVPYRAHDGVYSCDDCGYRA